MAKIQILRGIVLEGGQTAKIGDKVEVDARFAKYLVAHGKAKAVKSVAKKTEKKTEKED